MPATPLSLVFQAASNLTGGLVNDLTTVIVAIITLSFIVLGLDYLLFLFKTLTERGETEKADILSGPARLGAHYRQSSDPFFRSSPTIGNLEMERPFSSDSREISYSEDHQ